MSSRERASYGAYVRFLLSSGIRLTPGVDFAVVYLPLSLPPETAALRATAGGGCSGPGSRGQTGAEGVEDGVGCAGGGDGGGDELSTAQGESQLSLESIS